MSAEEYDGAAKFCLSPLGLVCSQCVYFKHMIKGDLPDCDAFPDGIPDEFLTNTIDHREPDDGDQGLHFEPRPEIPRPVLTQRYAVLDRIPTPAA